MSRRKQAKPRFLKHDEIEDGIITTENNNNDNVKKIILNKENLNSFNRTDETNDDIVEECGDEEDDDEEVEDDEDVLDEDVVNDDADLENEEEEEVDEVDEETTDSFCSDVFSSHTSSSFSPSLSDDVPTPNSLTPLDNENNLIKKLQTDNNNDGELQKSLQQQTFQQNGKKLKNETRKIEKIKISTDGSYHCQFCEKTFPRLGYLKKHEQSHAEHMPFKCEFCARLFKHKRSRDRHTKLHTGDRRYKCPHCEAAFSRSDHLKIHMKTHDNQKPFQCTVCNRGYNTAAALTSHMQNHKKQATLMGSPNLSYSPRSTGSTSSNCSNLQKRKYSVLDTTILPTRLACLYCTKSDFLNPDQLSNHVQTMHGGIPTPSIRNETPTSISSPNYHQLTCEFCTMKFNSIQLIFQHLKTTHMDRISSPSSYLEHFNRNLMSNYDLINYRNTIETKKIRDDFIKIENKTPDIEEKQINVTVDDEEKMIVEIKQEEQDSPTDLSQPKIRKLFKDEPNLNNNNNSNGNINNNLITNENHKNNNEEEKITTSPTTPTTTTALTQPGTFLCNQCNAALPDFETFRTHLKTHLDQGIGSYLCQHCGVAFHDQQIYEKHVFSHFLITNTEYSCSNNCNKTFTKQEEYQKHLFDTHTQQLYKCDICSEIFDTKVALQVHFTVSHINEIRLYRCSACMEIYRNEREFRHHVRSRHIISGAIQCIFCRAICSSELEMHFHLAAHARQYRCPICTETFHVEFLLDRHLQTHHHQHQHQQHQNTQKDIGQHQQKQNITNNNNNNNINNNLIEYPNKIPYGFNSKLYNSLQIDTLNTKHPNLLHGLYDQLSKTQQQQQQQRYQITDNNNSFLTTNSNNKGLLGIYNHPEMIAKLNNFYATENLNGNNITNNNNNNSNNNGYYPTTLKTSLYENTTTSVTTATTNRFNVVHPADPVTNNNNNNSTVTVPKIVTQQQIKNHNYGSNDELNIGNGNGKILGRSSSTYLADKGYSCGMCDRCDFSTESEVHQHRKLVHNLKTGVSLRCAYCNGDFRSRTELENHMKISHNTSGKHKCLICDEIFPSPAVLAEHKLTHCKVGPSIVGRCSHCFINLNDVIFFKSHLNEHNGQEIPVQCICCRQTLNSEFEIGLHAKFHTKSSDNKENTCALCLENLPANAETRVCENCYKKHNLSHKNLQHQQTNHQLLYSTGTTNLTQSHLQQNGSIETQCNLCKKILPSSMKLQEHLIEHTFAGCEERGYICYICSSVFTVPFGLQTHIIEHGLNARPFDCSSCTAKFFFRAELDHHNFEHEMVTTKVLTTPTTTTTTTTTTRSSPLSLKMIENKENVKQEIVNDVKLIVNNNNNEEEEYIEVENIDAGDKDQKFIDIIEKSSPKFNDEN